MTPVHCADDMRAFNAAARIVSDAYFDAMEKAIGAVAIIGHRDAVDLVRFVWENRERRDLVKLLGDAPTVETCGRWIADVVRWSVASFADARMKRREGRIPTLSQLCRAGSDGAHSTFFTQVTMRAQTLAPPRRPTPTLVPQEAGAAFQLAGPHEYAAWVAENRAAEREGRAPDYSAIVAARTRGTT